MGRTVYISDASNVHRGTEMLKLEQGSVNSWQIVLREYSSSVHEIARILEAQNMGCWKESVRFRCCSPWGQQGFSILQGLSRTNIL